MREEHNLTDTTTYQNDTGRRRRPKRLRRVLALSLAGVLGLGGLAGCASADTGIVTLDFFQFKPEAIGSFEAIIAEFEVENPGIRVRQNAVPDADTAIRTLLVKGKVPDVISLNGSGNFGQLARAGVFHDFTDDPVLKQINPAVQDILAGLGSYNGDEVNALGFVSNANGILYNRDIFTEQGISVPTTWDELIAACDRLKAAGISPFYGTLADSWTTMPPFTGLGGQLGGDGFFPRLRAEGADVGPDSAVSFTKDYAETLGKLQTLYSYAQPGFQSRGYEDGNQAFAAGKSAMLLQGVWAIAPILADNPDVNVGAFPLPATDDPAQTRLVSGVDVAITIGRDTPHLAEAQRFVDYLFDRKVLGDFAASQNMFSTAADAGPNTNPTLTELQPYFDAGRIVGFIDHQVPASIPLPAIIQQFLLDQDSTKALSTLDNEWRKVAARTTSTRSGE
ncbi:extracellular solute-binding protein [Cryobacterium mannosilyticum]|uniref:Extracellular solute-binding protein n=1 Tax=Cryobacterium mannosilyticum TaxID=1259190 RepID=A0A4R8W3D1_9MICO|nr:extracellular solute-binding protein [Cryobacterium mannosilyticum]